MTMFTPAAGGDFGEGFGYNLAVADRIYTAAMTGLYGWTALGLGVAGAVAWLFNAAGIYVGLSFIGMILGLALAIGCLFGMQFAARKGAPLAVIGGLYLLFTALMGSLLAYIFAAYAGATISAAFAGACGLFALMSVFGLTTKKDLSKLGTLVFIALIGMVVVGLLNAFLLQSSGLQLLLSVIALPVFMGLTAWETQAVKKEAQEAARIGDTAAAGRIALMGAAGMFLSIVNMFLALLHIFSFFRGRLGGGPGGQRRGGRPPPTKSRPPPVYPGKGRRQGFPVRAWGIRPHSSWTGCGTNTPGRILPPGAAADLTLRQGPVTITAVQVKSAVPEKEFPRSFLCCYGAGGKPPRYST